MKAAVFRVDIFKRKGSRFWQAKGVLPATGETKERVLKRVSTRTIIESSAKQFAELAYNHFKKLQR